MTDDAQPPAPVPPMYDPNMMMGLGYGGTYPGAMMPDLMPGSALGPAYNPMFMHQVRICYLCRKRNRWLTTNIFLLRTCIRVLAW